MSPISTSKAFLWLLGALGCASTAAQASDDPMCRNGLFADEAPFQLARIEGEGRSPFYRDMDGCPDNGIDCRTGRFVVPGDLVIISKLRGEYACAFYVPSQTAGWVKTGRLALQRVNQAPAPQAWVGQWQGAFGAEDLVIKQQENGLLHITGQAFWPGKPGETDWPSIHDGMLEGTLRLLGNRARYDDADLCEVNFTLLGDYLVAGDNRQCGGANVSFTSVYRRVR